jgi:cell division septation protein DedD
MDPRAHAFDDHNRHAGFVYVLMLVVALAFGGFLWQLYSAPEGARVTAPPSPPSAETAPISAPDPSELSADAADEEAVPVEENAPAAEPLAGPPQLAPLPAFVADGRYAVQLAALQNEASATRAWERLSSRAPGLFANAQLDIERADLGPRGIFYRLRAGYFADRDNAARFCQRLRQMGQDCIAVAR